MSRPAILVDSVSKLYRIGVKRQRSDTLVGAIATWVKSPIDNYRRLKRLTSFSDEGDEDDVIWALRDISFEVDEGEIVGIVGRNGAGKSTLLKILSRITAPTFGFAEMTGRVSSLLEVGTGFHGELTGRENVYLNGTIHGMRKREIDDKLDEIVDFAGVERFFDTPVKWYSSGMKVRLAFSVAAHLEPEILLVDEVLAVGDLQFQRKCLGRMDAVAKEGRTVLFVSHNLAAIERLCKRTLVITEGRKHTDSPTQEAISSYLDLTRGENGEQVELKNIERGRGLTPVLSKVQILDEAGRPIPSIRAGQSVQILVEYEHTERLLDPAFVITFSDPYDQSILRLGTRFQLGDLKFIPPKGAVRCRVDSLPLAPGQYSLTVACAAGGRTLDQLERLVEIDVITSNFYRTGRMPDSHVTKCLARAEWELPGQVRGEYEPSAMNVVDNSKD